MILLTTVLVTGIETTGNPVVFADSRILKQDTNQNANCDTVGADSSVPDSCNQAAANNVNNGVPRTRGTLGNSQTTGTLTVRKVCVTIGGAGTCKPIFNIQVSGNNPNPSSFPLTDGGSQSVTLGSGQFSVVETPTPGFTTSFSGDCMQATSGSQEATGTICPGQHLICTITNTGVSTPGTLQISEVCLTPSGSPTPCNIPYSFTIQVTGNNPQPPSFILNPGGSQSVTLSPGSFSVSESGFDTTGFATSFSGDCSQTSSGSGLATGSIASGQHLSCNITNKELPGTLIIRKVCNPGCSGLPFEIRVQGNEPNQSPPVFLIGETSRAFTLNPGIFTVDEITLDSTFAPSFSGDCTQAGTSPNHATGTIRLHVLSQTPDNDSSFLLFFRIT